MPAEQNMSVVRAIYEAFGKGDVEAVLANVTDDVDWAADAASTAAPWYGPRKGKAGVAGFFSGLAGAIDVLEFSPLSIASTEDEVLAVLRFRLASKATGREAAMHLHHYWRLRDGKVAYYRGSEDTAQTLAALAS